MDSAERARRVSLFQSWLAAHALIKNKSCAGASAQPLYALTGLACDLTLTQGNVLRSAWQEKLLQSGLCSRGHSAVTTALAGSPASLLILTTSASASRMKSEARKALLSKKGITSSSSYSCAFSRSVLRSDKAGAQDSSSEHMQVLQLGELVLRSAVCMQPAVQEARRLCSPHGHVQGGAAWHAAAQGLEARGLTDHALQEGHEQLVEVGRLLDVLGRKGAHQALLHAHLLRGHEALHHHPAHSQQREHSFGSATSQGGSHCCVCICWGWPRARQLLAAAVKQCVPQGSCT